MQSIFTELSPKVRHSYLAADSQTLMAIKQKRDIDLHLIQHAKSTRVELAKKSRTSPELRLCQQVRVCCPECSFSPSLPVWSSRLKGSDTVLN